MPPHPPQHAHTHSRPIYQAVRHARRLWKINLENHYSCPPPPPPPPHPPPPPPHPPTSPTPPPTFPKHTHTPHSRTPRSPTYQAVTCGTPGDCKRNTAAWWARSSPRWTRALSRWGSRTAPPPPPWLCFPKRPGTRNMHRHNFTCASCLLRCTPHLVLTVPESHSVSSTFVTN